MREYGETLKVPDEIASPAEKRAWEKVWKGRSTGRSSPRRAHALGYYQALVDHGLVPTDG